ncbi:hypothetical protein AAMO2058_001111100 [Amorphochlora amoebiformis]
MIVGEARQNSKRKRKGKSDDEKKKKSKLPSSSTPHGLPSSTTSTPSRDPTPTLKKKKKTKKTSSKISSKQSVDKLEKKKKKKRKKRKVGLVGEDEGTGEPTTTRKKAKKEDSQDTSTGVAEGAIAIPYVFVGNLNREVRLEEIVNVFEEANGIVWLRDKKGRFKGRIILRFPCVESAKRAISKHQQGTQIAGREIKTEYAKPDLMKGEFEPLKPSLPVNAGSDVDVKSNETTCNGSAEGDSCSLGLFVSNLPFTIQEDTLRDFLPGSDTIQWLTDKRGAFKGRAIVTFRSVALSEAAKNKSGETLLERPISISIAKPDLLKNSNIKIPTHSASRPHFHSHSHSSQSHSQSQSLSQSQHANDASERQKFGGIEACAFVSNLPFDVDETEIYTFFPNARSIEYLKDRRGKFKGRALVEFDSKRAALEAQTKSGEEIKGRPITVAPPKAECLKAGFGSSTDNKVNTRPTQSGNSLKGKISERPEGCNVVFVAGVDKDVEDEHMHNLFKDCGEISEIRWIFDRRSGVFKQCGCVEFKEEEAVDRAILKAGSMVLGRPIRINFARPKGSRR